MSFDILSPAEPLDSSLFIEASAGTGKTFVIEHYVVRLLLSTDFSIERLVLITFTNAVARELRRRLSKTIAQAASMIHDGDGSFEYLASYAALEPENRRRYLVRLDEAQALLSKATITTIHGFCDTFLGLYERQQGLYLGRSYMSKVEQQAWIVEFLKRYTLLSKDQWRTIAKSMRYQESVLIEKLVAALEEPLAPQTCCDIGVSLRGSGVAQTLCTAAACFRGTMKKDKTLHPPLVAFFGSLEKLIEEGLSEKTLAPLFGHDFCAYFSTPLQKSRPLSDQERYVLEKVRTEVWPGIDEQIHPEKLFSRLAADCTEALLSYMKKSGKKTPNSVVKEVFEQVARQDCCACAGKNFSCVIVDEFQDTDALQWDIIEHLFVTNPHFQGRMLFVGDPKQAIYGFRKADVYNYLAVRDLLPQETIRTLSVNYRAEQEMVLAQNRLFCGEAQPWLFYLPSANRYLLSPPASANTKSASSSDDRKAVHFMVFEGELGRCRRWPHDAMERDQIFPALSNEIISLYEQGVAFHEMAILVKDRYQAKHLLDFLHQKEIPATSLRVDSVLESPVYIWLQHALAVAVSPENRQAISSLYHCMGNHLAQIPKMIAAGRLDQWAEIVTEWKTVQEAFQRGGMGGLSRALFPCRLDKETTVEKYFLSQEHGGQLITDLEHLLELLFRLESRLPHSLESFHEASLLLAGHFSEDPSVLLRRVDPARRGVALVTMHASKGLEFPYVFALGCASRTPVHEEEATDERDSEKFRLLYVTITRAKKRCYIPILIEAEGKAPEEGRASPMELLASSFKQPERPDGSWHAKLYEKEAIRSLKEFYKGLIAADPELFSTGNCMERRLVTPSKTLPAALPYAPILASSVRCCSFTSLHKKSPFFTTVKKKGADLSPVQFGVLFHEIMAKLLQAPSHVRSSKDSVELFMRNLGFLEALPVDLVYSSLHVVLPLQGEELSLAQIPNEEMRVECSFMDKLETSAYQTGTIDVLIFRKGVAYVVDWKTQEVPVDCTEYFHASGYDQQAQIYLEAAKKAFAVENAKAFFVFVRHLEHGGIVTCP